MVRWHDYNKYKLVVFRNLPPCNPPHQGGLLGRAELQQRPRPHEGDVQSDRNDHDWVRGFDWLNR